MAATRTRTGELSPSGGPWLLGSLALVLLPHVGRFPLWLSLFCFAAIAWRGLRDRHRWQLPPTWLRLLVTIGCVAAVVASYRTLFGRNPGAALLAVMLCLKLLEMKSRRDAAIVVFLGFFLVVSGFLYDQTIMAGGYLLFVSLALTATLVALADRRGKTPLEGAYLKTAGGILLQALPMMAVLFVLFPRLAGPLWGLPEDAFSGRTGLGDSLTMGSITSLADSNEVAFRVEFHGRQPPAEALYWRGPILWRTDGRRWERVPGLSGQPLAAPEATGSAIEYSITLEPHDKRWIMTLDLPGKHPADGEVLLGYDMVVAKPVKQRRRDRLVSYPSYNTGPLDPGARRLALDLPGAANPRTRVLGARWRMELNDPEAVVERAVRWFSEGEFYYTRRPPPLEDHPVDRFLFETRRGFCEHYAAAFTMLMRAAGVPARVVTGYQGGEYNRFGDYLIVRQSDAHAWSEVWLASRGWVRVDPTAAVPPERVESSLDLDRFETVFRASVEGRNTFGGVLDSVGYAWDAANHQWNEWILGYGPEKQQALLRHLGLGETGWRTLGLTMSLAVTTAMLLAAALALRGTRPHVAPEHRLYERFCRKAGRLGIRRQPWEGPVDFAERLKARRPDLGPRIELITRIYTRLRYSGRTDRRRWLKGLAKQVAGFRP